METVMSNESVAVLSAVSAYELLRPTDSYCFRMGKGNKKEIQKSVKATYGLCYGAEKVFPEIH
jgi:hypothetical protein